MISTFLCEPFVLVQQGIKTWKRHKYLQVRCDLQMASIYFFCIKTEFTGFSVLSYHLLGVKSQIYHKKCCHKIKFMFIYNSCITLLIRMYIVLSLFNFAHHCFSPYGSWPLMEFQGYIWSCWTSFQLHRDWDRQLWVTVYSSSYFGWTVITVSLNFKRFLSLLKNK